MTNNDRNDRTASTIRVLLIEPDQGVAKAIKRSLGEAASREFRFDITHHSDAAKARAEIAADKPAVAIVILSGAVSGSTVFEIHRRLREKKTDLPIVLLFNTGQEDEAATALRAGFENVFVRDPAGGYLKWLPALVASALFRMGDARVASRDRMAIIVQSDPESTEYKMAEQALRASRGFWNTLVESPFEYVILVDRSGTIQHISHRVMEVSYSDVIGKRTVFDFVLPEQREGIKEKLDEVFVNGQPVHYESYSPAIERWFSNVTGPVYQDNEVVGASIFARDITEQKRIENELKESERRFRQLAETIQDVFYILDLVERRALYVSPAYEAVYGLPVEAVYANAMVWMDAVHPDDRETVESDIADMMRICANEYQGHGYRIIKPDGSIRWIQHRAFAIRDGEGKAVQIAGVVTDVTEATEAAERLRESELKYRTLVDQASDAIFVTDLDGTHVDINDSGCRMFGYSRDELLSMNFRELVLEEDLAKDPPQINKLVEGQLIIKQRRARCKDGSIISVEGSFKAQPGGLIQAIIRDITERKRVEEELRSAHDELRKAHSELERRVEDRTRELEATSEAFERSRRLASIGTLAAGIAHEINNPIGSILMAADMALYSIDDPKEKPEVEEALNSIKEDAKRAGRIVKTVLQLSRQEVSRKWPHDLGDIARRARDITRRIADANRVGVVTEIEPGLPEVVINPTEIEQVFVNVISNAIESSKLDQKVIVRVFSDGGDVRAVFEDKGHGMTKEEVGRVFDPFFTTRQNEGGTGLGMSLTHSIVHLHGGKIEITSKPGEGTRVTIAFPAEKPQKG